MIFMGVDPGSRVSGYALLESVPKGGIKVLEYGVIRCGTEKELVPRLKRLSEGLEQVFEMYRPQRLVLEDVFLSRNVRSALLLGQARGVVIASAIRFACEVVTLSPREIKQAVTGRGSADKEQVALMVKEHLGLLEIPRPADASDALAMAWVGMSFPQLKGVL